MNSVLDSEESKMLSLEQGRALIKNTKLSEISDEELQELLETVKIFCEINFALHLNAAQSKIISLDMNSTDVEKRTVDLIPMKKAA